EPSRVRPDQFRLRAAEVKLTGDEFGLFVGAPFGALIAARHQERVGSRIVGSTVEFDAAVPARAGGIRAVDLWRAVLIELEAQRRTWIGRPSGTSLPGA